jgi:hypothetical protein
MWAQGHKEYSAWSLLMFVGETIFLCPDTRDLRILGVQGKLLVEAARLHVRLGPIAYVMGHKQWVSA